MDINRSEAHSLLEKWREERRLIQVGLIASIKSGLHTVGRIEELDGESLRIDARSLSIRIGRKIGLTLDLSEVRFFQFDDWRDAPPELAQQLRNAYEGFLFLDFGHCHCELYAAKTKDELPPE